METEKVDMKKLFETLENAAKSYGFDRIWFNEYGTFVAEYSPSRIEMRVDEKYGEIVAEISWASAGTPRPTDDEVCKHAEMVGKAHTLKMLFETLRCELK